MPFINQVISFIDQSLKEGSLNKEKLQPVVFHGLSTVVARRKTTNKKEFEYLPGKVTAAGIGSVITPESKKALQTYHRILANTYLVEKKGEGDSHFYTSNTDMMMVVFTNAKLSKVAKEAIEPLFVFGMPQKLSSALLADIKINNCLISVVSSNLDHVSVFRQEFPQSTYFLNEDLSMFSIRYKIAMTFSQRCVDKCLCD